MTIANRSDNGHFDAKLLTLRSILRQALPQFVLDGDVTGLLGGEFNKEDS